MRRSIPDHGFSRQYAVIAIGMRFMYNPAMLREIRSLLVVMDEGGVNQAAARLGLSQPTVSRHIFALEAEWGGKLFERGARGMRATSLGFFVREKFAPLLRDWDLANAETLAHAGGRHGQLRIGFIGSAAARHLNPALARLKHEYPAIKLFLFDQTPHEQLNALREGRIDVALSGQDAGAKKDEFHSRIVAKLGVVAVLPSDHPMAERPALDLSDLRGERFIGVAADAVPGRNAWMAAICAKAGFHPRFIAETSSISETFALIAGEGAVALIPDYMDAPAPPGIHFVPLKNKAAQWNLLILRQRGPGPASARRLVELIAG
jgi:DNA-binding transcriptional LysR family regulator